MSVTRYIAVLNAGSSSIKFALYPAGQDAAAIRRGQIEGIGVAPQLTVRDVDGETIEVRRFEAAALDHDAATRTLVRLVADAVGAEEKDIAQRMWR